MQHQGRGRSRRGDTDRAPFEVGDRLHLTGKILAHGDDDAGKTPKTADADHILALVLHADRVFVGAGHDIHRTAHQRLQRLGAAREIVDRDVEPLLFKEALLFRNRQRQVIQQRLAADAKRHVCLFRRTFL